MPPIKNAPQPPPRNLGAGHYDERVVASGRDPVRPSKRQKYGAVKTTVDNIVFDSKKEAARYQELKLREKAGEISDLQLQEQFPLHVVNHQGVKVQIGTCRMDFSYTRNGERVREDSKGVKNNEAYRQRKRHVEAEYGITILET